MYHYHRLFKALQHYIVLLIIGVSGHLGWVSGVLFGGKARSRLLLEGLGVKELPI